MQTSIPAASITPLPTAAEIRAAHRYNVLRHYTNDQADAARCFDSVYLEAAFTVLRINTGAEFEHWAYDLGLKGCCEKDHLPTLRRLAA